MFLILIVNVIFRICYLLSSFAFLVAGTAYETPQQVVTRYNNYAMEWVLKMCAAKVRKHLILNFDDLIDKMYGILSGPRIMKQFQT